MPRPRQISKVQLPPRVKGFVPVGYYHDPSCSVQLNVEEYEVIRLLDYEGLSQADAAMMMQVSRPTITRIYERARHKIAKAITEACQIVIEGGKAVFNGEWYTCERCESNFNNPAKEVITQCPLCHSAFIQQLSENI